MARNGTRRSEVVKAAATLFSQRGYHGTSMRHLGSAVGLLRGSLYAHIDTKEELLHVIADEGAEAFLERAERALSLPGGAAERLRALLVAHIETVAEHLDAATVFLNEWRYLSDPLRSGIKAKRDRYEALVRRVIHDGIESGDFRRDVDVEFAARLVLSAGNWTYTWYRPDGELGPTEIADRYADLIVKGLTP